jgi:hypothetical protein
MDTYALAVVEIDGNRKEMDVEEALVEGEGKEGQLKKGHVPGRGGKRRFNGRKESKAQNGGSVAQRQNCQINASMRTEDAGCLSRQIKK